MITISKAEHGFLRRHWKAECAVFGLICLTISGIITLAYAEGVFADPGGHLNDPFTLTCHSGQLADTRVTISDDGEYNWMFAKGQTVNMNVTNASDAVVMIYWIRWSSAPRIEDARQVAKQTVQVSYLINTAGHYQLELTTRAGQPVTINVQAFATATNVLMWNCFNPGDLFRTD